MSEIRFRDETREVPDHIALRLAGINARFLTYEEAMDVANKREVADLLNAEQRKMISQHMKGLR